MTHYNPAFAKIYNREWKHFASRAAPLIQEFYERTAAFDRRRLLDLCCGTGQLAQHFLLHGYHVTGIDISPAMLDYAREHNREFIEQGAAKFVVGDAADYALDAPVDLVISTFDALNHLPDMAALEACFRCTAAVLEPEGWFIFDLNTRTGLRRWQNIQVTDRDDLVLITRGLFVDDDQRAYTAITGFQQREDGLFERFSMTAYNSCFVLEDVRTALEKSGFSEIHFANLDALDTPVEDPETLGRVFIIAHK